MDERKLKCIKMSLMEIDGDVTNKNKANYVKRSSGTFNITEKFYANLSKDDKVLLTKELVKNMYEELTKHTKANVDSLGLWIEYNHQIFENAIKLDTLNDIQTYGQEGINSVYEFLKMTIEKD